MPLRLLLPLRCQAEAGRFFMGLFLCGGELDRLFFIVSTRLAVLQVLGK